jgi:hypothetical protein
MPGTTYTVTPYAQPADVVAGCAWPAFAALPANAQTLLINSASKKIDQTCRRPFGLAQQSITEVKSGRNTAALWLKLLPVVSVQAITLNGTALDNTFGDAWTFHPGTGKVVRGDGQDDTRFVPWWPAGEENIIVQYWGGYSPIPDEIVLGTAYLVRYYYERGKVSGIYSQEAIADWSGTLNAMNLTGAVPEHVMALIADYVIDDAF